MIGCNERHCRRSEGKETDNKQLHGRDGRTAVRTEERFVWSIAHVNQKDLAQSLSLIANCDLGCPPNIKLWRLTDRHIELAPFLFACHAKPTRVLHVKPGQVLVTSCQTFGGRKICLFPYCSCLALPLPLAFGLLIVWFAKPSRVLHVKPLAVEFLLCEFYLVTSIGP